MLTSIKRVLSAEQEASIKESLLGSDTGVWTCTGAADVKLVVKTKIS